MSEKDQLIVACDNAASFPQNSTHYGAPGHTQIAYTRRLDEREDRLFCKDDGKAHMTMLECKETTQRFEENNIPNIAVLKQHFGDNLYDDRPDSRCTYIFFTAPHSREHLNVSRRMFTYILSYFQTMASFLDFVFPFGRQLYTQDFHFSGFRFETNLTKSGRGLSIPELGRSGKDFKMCYSLKSVEESPVQKESPWSIRQASIHHSFDVGTGVTTWIIVKANNLIKERIQAATIAGAQSSIGDVHDYVTSFEASLATHLLIAAWCSEEWRWYVGFLEEEFHGTTRRALAVKLETIRSPAIETKKDTTWSPVSSPAPGISEKPTWRSQNTLSTLTTGLSEKTRFWVKDTPTKAPLPPLPPGFQPPFPFPGRPDVPNTPASNANTQDQFSFESLQRVQSLEDRSNEVLLILDANISVLTEMTSFYKSFVQSESCPEKRKDGWILEFQAFEQKVASIIYEIRMQSAITKTLLRLLADRKSLLYGILEYRNMEASKLLAEKAQQSAQNMEIMTRDMNAIAVKTKQETVSMRIITLVTLFFLPGTFISTIMSTDIVHWDRNTSGTSEENFQWPALKVYLLITLPLMLVTFVAWYGVYWWVDRKENIPKDMV